MHREYALALRITVDALVFLFLIGMSLFMHPRIPTTCYFSGRSKTRYLQAHTGDLELACRTLRETHAVQVRRQGLRKGVSKEL